MEVEGVMLSYNYSENSRPERILTVYTSGIKFADRWVLAHGSMFFPTKEASVFENCKGKSILNDEFYSKLPEVYVYCDKGSKNSSVYDNVEKLSRERSEVPGVDMEHGSYFVRILTGRICHVWQCPFLDRCIQDVMHTWTIGLIDEPQKAQSALGKVLISVFALIDLESDLADTKNLRPLSSLLDISEPPPDRGSMIEIHSSPFGCETFMNTTTKGLVCGLFGRRPTLMLTDAATALGCEGGPVFTVGPEKKLVGIVICSLAWCHGEWVGLTLVAPIVSLLASKLRVELPKAPRTPSRYPTKEIMENIDATTMQVQCGDAWGTGLYLGGGFVLTCSHVLKYYKIHKVSVYCQSVCETATVRFKTADGSTVDLALLYTNPQSWDNLRPVVFAERPAKKGEPVLAAGFPYFSKDTLSDLKATVTAGHVNNVSPSMLQTSCCVQAGFSGGPIYRIREDATVEMVAIIVSNVKSQDGPGFPSVNMAMPVQCFKRLIEKFMTDKDARKLRALENTEEIIKSQWRLLPYRSKI